MYVERGLKYCVYGMETQRGTGIRSYFGWFHNNYTLLFSYNHTIQEVMT